MVSKLCPTCGFYEDIDYMVVDDAKGVGFVCDKCNDVFTAKVNAEMASFKAEVARFVYNSMVNEYQAEIDQAHEESFYADDYVSGDGE